MIYEWKHLGASIKVLEDYPFPQQRWFSMRYSVYSMMFPRWPSIYSAFDPLLGLILDKIDQASSSMDRLLTEELFAK